MKQFQPTDHILLQSTGPLHGNYTHDPRLTISDSPPLDQWRIIIVKVEGSPFFTVSACIITAFFILNASQLWLGKRFKMCLPQSYMVLVVVRQF